MDHLNRRKLECRGGPGIWLVPDFRLRLAQLSFLSFAPQHCNFRKSFAKVSHSDPVAAKGSGIEYIMLSGFSFSALF